MSKLDDILANYGLEIIDRVTAKQDVRDLPGKFKADFKALMLDVIEQSVSELKVYDAGEVIDSSKTVGYYGLCQKVEEL